MPPLTLNAVVHSGTEVICFRASEMKRPFVIERQVGEKTDQVVKDECDQARVESNHCSCQRYKAQPVTWRWLQRLGARAYRAYVSITQRYLLFLAGGR
jgi:hypothetical protein